MKNKDKPTILFIAPLPPPVHGSAVVSQQIKDSKIINEAFICDWVNLSTSRNMEEIQHFKVAKLWRVLSSLVNTLCLLMTRRYDLCYIALTCHGKPFLKDMPFALLCKLFDKKLVIHQHNKGMSKDVDRWPYRWLFPMVYRNTKVILLSWRLYPDIEKVVRKEDVIICPNGINIIDSGIEDNSSELYVYNDKKDVNKTPRLLFLSNMIESKGVIVLLDALKILMERGYSFQCDFVGGETKEIDAKRFAEEVNNRGLNRVAFYKGKKYGKEKWSVFKQSDIFVFPTYYENEAFPLVILEAMAHRLPVVTTNEGGIPDIVVHGKNGFISERNNPESLADCIAILLNDKNLRREMGDEGYRILKERYTEEQFEERMLEILNEICSYTV